MQIHQFFYREAFKLECGIALTEFQLQYATIGKLNEDKSNVIWVCHALTANAQVTEWWPGIIGRGKLFDPEKYFIICANMLGSCYGSTEALSINPETGIPFYHDFPLLTNRDIVRAFDLLRIHLGFTHIHMIIGGSMGGQQALEWAIIRPHLFEYLIPIATNAQHSPWGIAFNESQRMAISADKSWQNKSELAGIAGMRAARSIALLSYRGYETYFATQQEETDEKADGFKAASYQQYQGDKLAKRFNAFAYWNLSKAMDSQNVGRARGGVEKALANIQARTLVIGITSDILFPVREQRMIQKHIRNAEISIIESIYGHDGFLIEVAKLTQIIGKFQSVKEAE